MSDVEKKQKCYEFVDYLVKQMNAGGTIIGLDVWNAIKKLDNMELAKFRIASLVFEIGLKVRTIFQHLRHL